MEDKNKAITIIKKAREDFSSGKISRRDFNSIMITFGAIAGYTLFSSFAQAWTGTRMRKSSGDILGHQILRSLRIRSSTTAYLSRTLGANSTSSTTLTWSGWVKRGTLGTARATIVFCGNSGASGNLFDIEFNTDALRVYCDGGAAAGFTTTALYRDPTAWLHIVVAYDTTQATAANRLKLWVNGIQTTAFSSVTYPSLNQAINASSTHVQTLGNAAGYVFDGYIAEAHFIDGQGLTASSFGEFSARTGAWVPKKYLGTYGTNGYYLDFKDPTSTTTLCYDRSGNSNHFTPNNISIAAGATYDSMTDVPFNGGTLGNFATINPLYNLNNGTVIEGNLYAYNESNGTPSLPHSTIMVNKGKWYFEAESVSNGGYGQSCIGVRAVELSTSYLYWVGTGGDYSTYGTYGCAFDADTGKIWIRNSAGAWSSGNPVTGTSPTFTATANALLAVACYTSRSSGFTNPGVGRWNFGQRPFAYAIPTGFKTLHTGNLETPTIIKPNQYFDVSTHTGNGGTQTISGVNFQSDLIWVKTRNSSTNHQLQDSVRGLNLSLASSTSGIEGDNASVGVTSATTTGFSVGAGSAFNASATTYVNWLWKKGATPGFDIVANTLAGVASQSFSHSLGVAPAMIISKFRNLTSSWAIYHKSLGPTKHILMESTAAAVTSSVMWNNTAPTSTQFTLGAWANAAAYNLITYLFAEIDGYSKFGTYTGNGSTDGPFVYCGFKSKWIMFKRTDSTSNWQIYDTTRESSNKMFVELVPNSSEIENSVSLNLSDTIDITAAGFKLRNTGANCELNVSGATYIFAAFAEVPFKYAGAR